MLNIQNLTIGAFQNNNFKPICKNLNFSIGLGETVGILGESGSGKSITALAILQLLPPGIVVTGGSIEFTGSGTRATDLTKAPLKQLQAIRGKEISMIFQEPMSSLNPVFTCGSQVKETILRHQNVSQKEAREITYHLFNKVKLPEPKRIFDSYPYQISGGQIQRVMIAMAVSCKPKLLIADEPTTALDVTVQRSILELLKGLQAEMNMSILFITHDINVNAEIAQRTLVFYKGEIVEQGETKQIAEHPQHTYTKGLINLKYVRGQNPANVPLKPSESLQISGLSVSYLNKQGFFGIQIKKQALQDINLDVFRGETLGLVGESGSGKTTLGRAIIKLIEPVSGTVSFNGKILAGLSGNSLKDFRKKVQIIFQDPYSSLNPKLTAGAIISEPLQVHKLCKNARDRKKRVMTLLKQVNLEEEHYYRYPHQFSGGQRQRIGIARALAVEPELIILDESVSALDAFVQSQILDLLANLKKEYGLTYIFISHDLNLVRMMSDRIIVLKDGKIIEEGLPNELFHSPKNPYTANLIAAIPGKK
jgi:peptide/nickel transport system ATP-binding protein